MDKLPYRKKFAKLTGAISFVVFCMMSMLSGYFVAGMDLGAALMINMLKVAIPYSLALAAIAYFIGRIFDKKQNRRKRNMQLKTTESGKIQSIFSGEDAFLEEANG